MPLITGSNEEIIKSASQKLKEGNLVAVPTETVYGLAAVISSQAAVEKIYRLKNRPLNHPLIMHVATLDDLYEYVTEIPRYAEILIKSFWPGPLTFIFKKSAKTPSYITGNQDTVAIRMPVHDLTLQLIKELKVPIVAPSANKFMGISPTRASHVLAEFANQIDVIDGGQCLHGIESTIIDATETDTFQILRPGAVSRTDIYATLANEFGLHVPKTDLKYSGSHKKHYSPHKTLVSFKNITELKDILAQNSQVFVIKYSEYADLAIKHKVEISSSTKEFAHDLYHCLRLADDDKNTTLIAIEEPKHDDDWESVWDRLAKAKYQE